MEFLRKSLVQVAQHLSGLTTSQRLAIGLCAVLVVLSMVWLLQWAAHPEMVPVVFEGFSSPDQLLSAENELRGMGIPYQVEGSKIFVGRSDRDRVLARLGERQMLPADTSLTIEKIIEDDSPFRSQADSHRIWAYAKANKLSKMLSDFRGIQRAKVVIDKPMRRGLGSVTATPTASVMVWTQPGRGLAAENVDAIAGFVAGAVAGLDATKVGITDARTGKSYRVRDHDSASAAASDLLELAKKAEEHYTQKVRDQLRAIPGVVVNIFAELESSARQEYHRTQDKTIDLEIESTKQIETRSRGGAEPGVVPNVGQTVASVSSPSDQSEKKTERIKSEPADERVVRTETGLGAIRQLNAAVNVPRSYLKAVFLQQPGNEGKEADDVALLGTGQLDEIRKQVMPLIHANDPQQVQVTMYYDVSAPALSGDVTEAASMGALDLTKTYGQQVGLGALAVVSLFMMLLLSRRAPVSVGADGTVLAGLGAGEIPTAEVLAGEAPPVGDAQEGRGILVAQELDEQSVRTGEMIDQLNDLVREDPASAAGLVKRWMEKENG